MSLTREIKSNIIKEFGLNEKDSGSADVQIAFLTHRIMHLTGHCQKFPKDASTKKGLLKMVCKRRRFLAYLETTNNERYKKIIGRLGLKK